MNRNKSIAKIARSRSIALILEEAKPYNSRSSETLEAAKSSEIETLEATHSTEKVQTRSLVLELLGMSKQGL
ncbi:unnamed protein product [Rhodiola kirilowii]